MERLGVCVRLGAAATMVHSFVADGAAADGAAANSAGSDASAPPTNPAEALNDRAVRRVASLLSNAAALSACSGAAISAASPLGGAVGGAGGGARGRFRCGSAPEVAAEPPPASTDRSVKIRASDTDAMHTTRTSPTG